MNKNKLNTNFEHKYPPTLFLIKIIIQIIIFQKKEQLFVFSYKR